MQANDQNLHTTAERTSPEPTEDSTSAEASFVQTPSRPLLRLSPWHLELAQRIADGQTNRDIMRDVAISASRLSVLKAMPHFQAKVEEYRQQKTSIRMDAYKEAMQVLQTKASAVAGELLWLAESKMTPPKTKLDACQAVLDRVAQAEGHIHGKTSSGQEVVFEQVLRVVKKMSSCSAAGVEYQGAVG